MRSFPHCLFAITLSHGPALAAMETPAQLCDQAALSAAQTHDIPPQVMLAITRVETGRQLGGQFTPWPWTINIAGEGHWFATPDEATSFANDAINRGTTNMDIGCFQVNLHWHSQNFSSLTEMFDPGANANYAADFLVKNYQKAGNWVDAVAAYHSTNPELAAPYIERVETILTDLRGADLPTAIAPRANSFPLLQAGSISGIGSLVPLGGSHAPLIGAAP